MHRTRWAIAATMLVLAACGGDDNGSAGSSTTTEDATAATTSGAGESPVTTGNAAAGEDCAATVPGSELNFGVYVPTASLDPLRSAGTNVGGTDLLAIYDSLMRWDPASGEWVPEVAQSLTSNDDFTQWTLKLRPGVTYSNGDLMVAQDVLDNMQRMIGPGINGSRALVALIDLAASSAPDDSTVVFQLTQPWSNFGYLLGDQPGMIVNPAVGAAVDAAGVTVIDSDPAGAGVGPYTVARWAPGESPYLVLKARPDYWGGAPCIETINFVSIPTDRPKLDALQLGQLDAAFLRDPAVVADARASGDFGEMAVQVSGGQVLLVNQGIGNFDPVQQDVRFRQAVAAAIDPKAVSERAYDGELIVQQGLIRPDSRWYTAVDGEPTYDRDRAKELVSDLKGEGWDGSIRLVCPDSQPDVPIALQAALQAVGMDVDVQVVDGNTHIAAVAVNKDYDLACWGLNITDSAVWRSMLTNFASDSLTNRIGYHSAEFDAAIDALYAAPDDDARRDAIATMSSLYANDLPVVSIGGVDEILMFRDNVHGIIETQQSMFMFQDAWIER